MIMKLLKFGYRLIRAFVYLFLKGSFKPAIRTLKADNEVCYVLGNGPSLINQLTESDFLQNQENLFVVNNFVLTDHYQIIKPRYYVFADPCYWDDRMDLEEYLKCQAVLQKVSNETKWKINIIAPKAAEACFRKHFESNKMINLFFLNTNVIKASYSNLTYFLYSKYYASPHCQNVLVLASYLALNIGYKEVNLLGAEHSWTQNIRVNNENQVCLMDKHFYDLDAKLVPWKKVDGGVYKMSEILVDLSKMFEDYQAIADYAKFKKAIVYNGTPNSFVDAFKRKII